MKYVQIASRSRDEFGERAIAARLRTQGSLKTSNENLQRIPTLKTGL